MPLIINHLQYKTVIDIEGVIGSTWEGLFSNDAKKKEITKENMRMELNRLKEVTSDKKTKNILVRVNTLGGSFNHAVSIHDYLKKSEAEITVEVYGMTASGGSVISQCASKGKRYISENALFLVHRAWNCFCGNAVTLRKAADRIESLDNIMINMFIKTTGKNKSEIEKLMNENNGNGEFYSGQDAKDNGFFDEVMQINASPASASAQNFGKFDAAALHLPDAPENYSAEMLPELPEASNEIDIAPLSRTSPASIKQEDNNKNNNPKQGVKGMKPEEVAKLNDLCGKDNAKFVLDASMDSNSSYEGSLESFVGKLQADNKAQGETLASAQADLSSANAENVTLKADNAALKDEAPPEPAGSAAADNQKEKKTKKTPEASVADRWTAALKIHTDAGMDAGKAFSAVIAAQPDLHKAYMKSLNNQNGE